MTRAERDRWVEALRSGKYQQGTNWLKRNSKYCCLGVKCDLDRVDWRPYASDISAYYFSESGRAGEPLTQWTGSVGAIRMKSWGMTDEQVSRLIQMNDSGKSFAEIADWIEANIPVTEEANA